MTPNSLSPSYAVVDYVSAFGSHKMTIPTLQWELGGDFGQYIAHDDITVVDAETMWTDFCDQFKNYLKPTATINSVTLYNKPTESSPSIPVAIIPIAEAGLSIATTPSKACQTTFNFRTTLFGMYKLVMLDTPVATDFAKTLPVDWGANDLAILGALSDLEKAFAGRDGAPVQSAISKTYTLNEKLRKAYGMA